MNDVVQYQGGEIATAQQVVAHVHRVQEIMRTVMKPEVHYGIIPGTKKNTLYKPGAEVLCVAFHIAPTYAVVEDRFDDGVRYRVTCSGVHQGTGRVVADGLGSCSSMEEKYKWCKAYPSEYDTAPVDRRRIVQGKDWTTKQVRVETADIENTLLKMACKRALIAMVLNGLAVSDIFAQDFDELSKRVVEMMSDEDGGEKKDAVKQPQSKSGAPINGTTGGTEGGGDSGTASVGQLAWVRSKFDEKITEAAVLAQFKIAALDGITVAQWKAIREWLKNPVVETAAA